VKDMGMDGPETFGSLLIPPPSLRVDGTLALLVASDGVAGPPEERGETERR
jgi:hypothetical protein